MIPRAKAPGLVPALSTPRYRSETLPVKSRLFLVYRAGVKSHDAGDEPVRPEPETTSLLNPATSLNGGDSRLSRSARPGTFAKTQEQSGTG
jgi:hypothetical protein